jgi:Holliday junction resolvase
MREAEVEKKIVQLAKTLGIYTRKFTSPSHRAVPDRIFICGGVVLFLEIKAKGKRPTESQRHEMALIAAAGGLVGWVDNVESAKSYLMRLRDTILSP